MNQQELNDLNASAEKLAELVDAIRESLCRAAELLKSLDAWGLDELVKTTSKIADNLHAAVNDAERVDELEQQCELSKTTETIAGNLHTAVEDAERLADADLQPNGV